MEEQVVSQGSRSVGGGGPIELASPEPPYDLAHELRTSLAIVTLLSGNLELLYDRLDDDRRRSMIQDLRRHMRRLNSLVVDVLDLCNDDGPFSI